MKRCPAFSHLLVLPNLRIQNANAISSPLTHGFPAMSAFLGLMWALERRTSDAGMQHLQFHAVGVVSHGWQEQVARGRVSAFRLTRNPVDKDGGSAAIVEEGRVHLDMGLAFAVYVEEWDEARSNADLESVAELLSCMRIAGGTVIPTESDTLRRKPWWVDMRGEGRKERFRRTCVRLLPGSALVARDDLLEQRFAQMQAEDPRATRLDAWLSLARVEWRHAAEADRGKGKWMASRRKGDGWVVPIPVGYGAISELHPAGSVRHARDGTTPFRFVESLYSMGEWVGVHRLREPEDFLWYADSRPEEGLYRCRNDYSLTSPVSTVSM